MEEEITVQNEGVLLQGTLTRPGTFGPHPLVIAAHTSGAGARDFGVYQHLAEVLSRKGIAVYLFDRRGSGASTTEFETANFYDLAADILAAIEHLKGREDIDPKHIGLWGMSQGAWIAPLAASLSPDVAFVVAVSAVGVSPAEQMNYSAKVELQEKGYSEEVVRGMLDLHGKVNAYYRGKADRSEVQAELNLYRNQAWFPLAYLDEVLPEDPSMTKWVQEMDFDPRPMMGKIEVPVLLLYGASDPWVPITRSISRWQEFGPKDTTIHQIDDANHFMISITHSGIRGDQGPQAKEYSVILTQWITNQLG